ncbi:helix-turn-helix domain-containing protein [Mucilaginibacter limnophilus]|uniref:histidine kinase n=2 Tax=Mucilaginibacter limnophilus TaxID=1932778 RepID=A0A437MSB0_9SPHI|nr:helix-turn-helix domain-containing protein [Mucilaginibacter limnophilus]
MLSGCGGKKHDPEYVIGFSQCVGSDLWRKTMMEEIKMELSLHPNATLVYADANGSSKTQIEQVKKMLNDGVDILIISPNEAMPLTPIVEQTYNKGIPVVVIDRKTSSNLYTAYVGADNYEIGKMAGEYAGNVLKGKGNIVEIMGLPGSSPAIERQRGFADGIKRFKDVKVTSQLYGNWLKGTAENQLLKSAASLNNVDMVFAHNDVMAAGARSVINRLRLNHSIKVVGIDALPGNGGGLQMVGSGVLNASMLYPTGGKEAIVTAFRILNKESFSKENNLQSLVIDSSNVQLMKLQWAKVSSQQKDIERQQALLTEQETLFKSQQTVLNITVITLVLAIIFGGLASYSLLENRKINKSLEAKNDEILSQRNKLIEMSAKAEMATEAKLNFFTNISHEFRTPLTLILSPLEDLLNNDKIRSVAGKNLNLIHKNAFRLLRLVNQLIEYRKIEYEKMQVNASPNNLVEFVKDIIDSFQHSAKKRNIDLRLIHTDAQNIDVWFDANMLDKVVFNLLANALKFTGPNGKIHVFIRQDDEYVYVDFQDNGIGMTDDEVLHVFEHFYQADTNSTKGSGLGLSLSKELMLLHHGDLKVSSKKWEGTTFTLTLKTGAEHFAEDEIKREPLNKAELYERSKVYTTDLDETTEIQNTDALRELKEQSVLIIEDNIDLLNYLSAKLSEQYEVYTASSGTAGLDSAYELVPDIIISDVVIPGIIGTELTRRLKSDIRTSHIPIILLTAKGSIEQQIHGIESMADAYIAKPFNYDYLLATAKNLLKNRALLKDHYSSDISTQGKVPMSNSLDKKFLNDFAGIVEQNLSNENFSVDDICKLIGISRVQLYRKVKALLNCSITDYILKRRLKKAKYLLINENYTIAEVTYMVGFATPNYFSTVFKAKYGITPTEFKRSQHI